MPGRTKSTSTVSLLSEEYDGTDNILNSEDYDDLENDVGHVHQKATQQALESTSRQTRHRTLERVEELLASHKRNRLIALAFLTVALVVLFAIEATYSLQN